MNKLIISGLLALAAAGCASIERTSPGMMDGLDVVGSDRPAETTICVRNYGIGLFYICTFMCGDASYDSESNGIKGGFKMFKDICNCGDCYRTLQSIADKDGQQLTNVSMVNNSLPNQGVTGWADFLGWFLETEDVMCSGVLRAK